MLQILAGPTCADSSGIPCLQALMLFARLRYQSVESTKRSFAAQGRTAKIHEDSCFSQAPIGITCSVRQVTNIHNSVTKCGARACIPSNSVLRPTLTLPSSTPQPQNVGYFLDKYYASAHALARATNQETHLPFWILDGWPQSFLQLCKRKAVRPSRAMTSSTTRGVLATANSSRKPRLRLMRGTIANPRRARCDHTEDGCPQEPGCIHAELHGDDYVIDGDLQFVNFCRISRSAMM